MGLLTLLTAAEADNLKNTAVPTGKGQPVVLGYCREKGRVVVQIGDKVEYVIDHSGAFEKEYIRLGIIKL